MNYKVLAVFIAAFFYCSAEVKTIIIRNRTGAVITVSAQDFQGKNYNQQLSCDADSINTNIPQAQLKISIDAPAKGLGEKWLTGRSYISSLLVNKIPLFQADLTEINKQIDKTFDSGQNQITIYLHKRPAPESWGDWTKNYIKETIGSYLGQTSKAPTFPYEIQFIKENGRQVE